MRATLPHALSLLVAILVGVLPLGTCEPTCGEGGGVVIAGTHAHNGHSRGECGHHHHGRDGAPSPDEQACCDDASIVAALKLAKVSLPTVTDGHLVSLVALPRAELVARAPLSPLAVCADSGPPPGVEGVVLLR